MSDAYSTAIGAMTPQMVSTMTADEAKAALSTLQSQYRPPPPAAPDVKDPAHARERLDLLVLDEPWSKRFSEGDTAARNEFARLTSLVADREVISAAMDGEPAPAFETHSNPPSQPTYRDIAAAVVTLKEHGFSEAGVRRLLTDLPVTRADYDGAKALQARLHASAEWRQKLFAGDPETKRVQLSISTILASTIEG